MNAPMNQSAYSALVNGRTVCAGYARAFQYLMQRLGIPCYYCTGYAGEDHAWNIIKLGEDYYNVDVTWDDTDTPTYDYFNKSDREFGTSHMRTGLAVYLPACGSGMDMQGNPVSNQASDAGDSGTGVSGTGTGNGGTGGSGGTGDGGTGGSGTGNGNGGTAGDGTGTDEQESALALINPTPVEPLRWHGGTGTDSDAEGDGDVNADTDADQGTDADTEPSDEAERQEALDQAGISEEEVRDTMEEYYEDCGRLLREVGTGDRQFTNVIPKEMWNSVEQAYNNGAYRSGYVEDALEAMDAESFVIMLQAQDIGGGYYRLYHNVYTY